MRKLVGKGDKQKIVVDSADDCNYIVSMKSQIVQIGNSQGIRIPKLVLEESGLSGEVELLVVLDGLLIKPLKSVRHRWAEMFRENAEQFDEDLLQQMSESATNFETEKWRW